MVTTIGDTVNYKQCLADAVGKDGTFALYMRARKVKWSNSNVKTAEYNVGKGAGEYPLNDIYSEGGFKRTIQLTYIPYDASGTFASMKSMLNALSYWEKNNTPLFYWELNPAGNNWALMSDDDDNSTTQLKVKVLNWSRDVDTDTWVWNLTLQVISPTTPVT